MPYTRQNKDETIIVMEPTVLFDLSPAHQDKLFRQSGISVEVAAGRGYRTVTKDEDGLNYRENGWGSLVRFMPALEIPIWTPNGRSSVPQLRPDNPRVRDGKVVKYEFPPGESLHLDVHPSLVERVKGLEPLYITEGVLKADSATSRGACCVALMGVYGFRGTNLYGGLTALAEWQDINLANRDVYIVFDSDVVQKIQVRQALLAFSNFLNGKRARVHVVRFVPGDNGAKVGLDDYLVAGGTIEGLSALSTDTDRQPDLIIEDKVVYQTHGGVICEMDQNSDGSRTATRLCNFDARVKKLVVVDDGVMINREVLIGGSTALGTLPDIRIPTTDFASMSWVEDKWAGKAFVESGTSKDKLRVGIWDLTIKEVGVIDEEVHYAHVGWRKIGQHHYYLTASGGLHGDGLDGSIIVEHIPHLRNYSLEDQAHSSSLVEDVRQSIGLLDLGPLATYSALLGATYLAPLGEWVDTNFAVFIEGQTGSLKTESAALMQGHYGKEFNASSLPGAWISTGNSLEHQASQTKDAVFVVDDYKPAGNRYEMQKMQSTAERFIRSIGNRAGRGRLNPDATSKATYIPRGVVICTGEDLPNGESLRARIASVSLKPGDFNLEELTRAQQRRDEGVYARAMSGYIQWIARQTETIQATVDADVEILRTQFHGTDAHLRSRTIFGILLVGLKNILRFAVDIEAYSQAEADSIFNRSVHALLGHLPEQTAQSREQDPVNKFLEALQSGFAGGRCHLMATNTNIFTEGLEAFGWRTRDNGDHYPTGPCVGFVDFDHNEVFLIGSEAYEVAANRGGIDVTQRRLFQTMKERQMLGPRQEQNVVSIVKRTASGRVRVIPLKRDLIQIDEPVSDEQVAANLEEEQNF